MAEVVARHLGLSGALGWVAEHHDGVDTGRLKRRRDRGADSARRRAASSEER